MNGLFAGIGNGPPYSLMTIYIRFTHLDISVLAEFLGRLHAMHQTVVGVCGNTFAFPEHFKDEVRSILHIESVSSGNSMTLRIREGWAPRFQPETDDFLVDIPKALGVPAIIAYLLVSTIDKAVVSNSNFLDGTKKALEQEILENPDCTAIFNLLQKSEVKRMLEEQALALVQGAKSIDALRSVSVNGVNVLSFDVNRRKHRRYFINIPVQIAARGVRFEATMVNISRGGCVAKLNEPKDIGAGKDIALHISGLEIRPAETAVWRDGDRLFVRAIFNPPIGEGPFKEMVGF
jgi:hypothetical protein